MLTVPDTDQQGARLSSLRQQVARIYGPGGCLWAQEQTHYTLRRYVLEEADEVVQVLNELGPVPVPDAFTPETISPALARQLSDELGDLLFQVLVHAALAEREGLFTLDDVLATLRAKLERRHPHVFGEAKAATPEEVNQLWAAVKQEERMLPHAYPTE